MTGSARIKETVYRFCSRKSRGSFKKGGTNRSTALLSVLPSIVTQYIMLPIKMHMLCSSSKKIEMTGKVAVWKIVLYKITKC